jgi:sirohydrochlorin ferrochelatase
VASANEAVKVVAADAARQGGWDLYETAFLEVDPMLKDAVAALAGRGAESIVVLPYFLTLGIHLKRDLPALVEGLEQEYAVSIRVAPPLDGHAALSRILVERACEITAAEITA